MTTAIATCVVCECTDDTKVNQCGCVCHVPMRCEPEYTEACVPSSPWDRRKTPRMINDGIDRRTADRLESWEK